MKYKVCVVGLGYVGLPLAVASAKKYETLGFDINASRIQELSAGVDRTEEVSQEELSAIAGKLRLTDSIEDIRGCNFYVITVPTPVDNGKKPDLRPIIAASNTVSQVLKKGDYVVYESTVYPGCTEEVCVPILERSGLKFNQDFFCGYSPERINPGDRVHRLETIVKVTSGSSAESSEIIDQYYNAIVEVGTYKASSIKVAEAAKVIENTQRDINIAFVNELALIFNEMGLDTLEVLEAAGTKWNFLPFKPGLVGGHCIGVDPYYLTHKAEELGYTPQIILAGRRINDDMGRYVAQHVIKGLGKNNRLGSSSNVLILGFTFKENCPDVRNTRVIDIVEELREYGINPHICDPQADKNEIKEHYGLELLDSPDYSTYDAIIMAVAHKEFLALDWSSIASEVPVVYDVKGLLPKNLVTSRL